VHKPIAVVYHALFQLDDHLLEPALEIVHEQMFQLQQSGLLQEAEEVYAGINGGRESEVYADSLIPGKALKVYHGLQCHTELRTLMLLQEVMKDRKGWLVLYFHSKGATRDRGEVMIRNWRRCMMHHLVVNWRTCISVLERSDACGCHWLSGQVDGTQNLFGGNFWWSTSEYLNKLPPIEKHPRIPINGGIDSEKARFESEVWLGSSGHYPRVVDFHPGGMFKCPPR